MKVLSDGDARLSLQKEVGQRIRAARQKQGLSQLALAHISGLHMSHISKIERGGANATLSSLLALGMALKFNPFEPLHSILLSNLKQTLPEARPQARALNESESHERESAPERKGFRHGA